MTSVNGATGTGSKHKRKVVGVVLLGGEELIVHVDVKGKLYEVFNQVAAHLSLRETEYFGLALFKDEEYQFLVLDEKISKVAPKKWKTSAGEGWDSDGSTPLFTVCFKVQFYVDQVVLLREKVTRHLYYLQLKENVLRYDHLYNEEKCFQIVGFALQADFGNFIAEKHTSGYFDPRLYFPAWMLEKRGLDYLANNCPMVHSDLHNMTRTDAELKYVRECSSLPGAHNLHFYRARMKKTDKACSAWLAVCYRGVEVYEDDAGFKNLISTFLWQDIGRIVFDKKKFEIRTNESAGGRRFAYYTEHDGISKYLLHICRATHLFQMAIQPKLMEIRHLDAEDKKRYKESYIYSDARDMHANGGPVRHRSSRSPGRSAGTQRCSVISDASSNTTSGIVSDRMATSFDEGEEAIREIIIDCPPRQRSLHGASAHSHTRVPPRSSYKMTPPASGSHSPALPPQSLELFQSPRSSGKGSPASPHQQEASPVSSNGSYRAKFKNTLRHSNASMGKAFGLGTPSPSSPYALSNPSPSSPCDWDLPGLKKSPSNGENFKGMQGTVLVNMERNVSGDSTTTSCSTTSTGIAAVSVENSPGALPAGGVTVGQLPSSPATRSPSFTYSPAALLPTEAFGGRFVYQLEQSASSQAGTFMLPPPMVTRLDVPSASPPLHHLPSQQSLPPLPVDERLYTDCCNTVSVEGMDVVPHHTGFAESIKVNENPVTFVPVEHCHGHPSQSSHGSGGNSSCSSTHGPSGSIDSDHVLMEGNTSAHHSAQSSEEDSGNKDSSADTNSPRKPAAGKRNTPARVKAGNRNKATHVSVKNQKEALHPDIEQILGQSQAQSLPFIMALCNDLMTGSTHSSTGSYDTSTLRSSDSHPDSRRWSSCLPADTSIGPECDSTAESLASGGGAGARPYSWHCEHFDLDTTLSAKPLAGRGAPGPVPPTLSPGPPPVIENHRSFPHDLSAACNAGQSALWTQAIANTSNSENSVPIGSSLDRYSPELIAQQLMIPSRLNSGGHSVTEGGTISHHKTLKENVGLA